MDEQAQPTTSDLSEPGELPDWAENGTVDLDAIRANTVARATAGPLVFESRATVREQTPMPVDGDVREDTVTRVRADGDREIGLYQSGTETDGGIDGDPRAASVIEERYHADGETYYYSDRGAYPSYDIDDGPFGEFVDQVGEDLSLLFEGADRITFESPVWDEANGVYVVRGTEIDDPDGDTEVDLEHCEMRIDADGVFLRGDVEFSINDDADGMVESTATVPDAVDISEPDWVPDDVGQLSVAVAVEDGSWTFTYGQGVVSEAELLLPANHVVELRTTGEYEHHQTFNVPGLSLKLDLVPDGERSRELFVSEGLVGESYDAYASEVSPGHRDLTATVRILEADDFEERVESDQ